ncbi:MAG: SRPBCC domain-containing protein [Thaumarchaeota archaeon]|nr:SRPBCC domain-containing protein [Nitrososphaerota archaeon]
MHTVILEFHNFTNRFVNNKKLVYTWQPTDEPGFPETIVTWELEEISKNKTRLTLTLQDLQIRTKSKAIPKDGRSFLMN